MSAFGFSVQGEFVWLDSGSGVPIGAEVKVTDTGQLQLVDDEGKVQKPSGRVQPHQATRFIQPPAVSQTGAQDQQEDGGQRAAHAPHLRERCGRHDHAGRPERGRTAQEPDGAPQGRHHLCEFLSH